MSVPVIISIFVKAMQLLLTTLNAKYIHTNLAIRLLYQLNKHHSGLTWKEFTIKENPDEVAAKCSRFEVVAFSCYIWNIQQTLEVTKRIKILNPACKILLGGPEVSYEWEDVMTRPDVDYIIAGEGELAFASFLNNYPQVESVPALIYMFGSEIRQNPSPPLFDLKQLEAVMPYADDEPESLMNKVLYLETSRGCPYKCEFCLASLDNKVRYLPTSSIKATLLYMMQHGRVVKFLDRTFNIKRDFSIEVFSFILEHHKPGNVFQFEITADILHPDIIRFIHDKVPAGLFRFEIGIQTVNQKANLEVSRKQNFDKTKRIIEELAYKVEMHLDLIVGLPLDYWDDIRYSFEEVFKLFAPELQLGFLKFLKGTTMRDKAQHGFVYDPNPPYQIIESRYLSKAELYKITQLEHALEIYWNGGKSIHTLKYVTNRYGSFDFLLGLGVYFGTKHDYHKYSLTDVFDVLMEYAVANYADDPILPQLIAVDYYLHFKVKPQMLFMAELPRQEKNVVIDRLKLNHHKFRFVILPLSFHFPVLVNENRIQQGPFHLILQYDGLTKAKVIETTAEQVLIN